MCCQCLGLWIDDGFLNNADKLSFKEPLSPLRNMICLGEDALAVQRSVWSYVAFYCIFR